MQSTKQRIKLFNKVTFTPKFNSTVAVWIGAWSFISALMYLKIPSAFSKIYAEDGALSLQNALEKSFPWNFFSPVAGYFDIVVHFAGKIVTLFPLEKAAQTFFFFNTFILSWIAITVYRSSSELIQNRSARLVLSLSLILLPIAGFESLANTANLHFFLMSACLPIFLKKSSSKYETYQYSFFVLIATCSIPLMIFYLPLIVFRRWRPTHPKWFKKPSLVESAWLVGIIFQVTFIFAQNFSAMSKSTGIHSIIKPGFLYLDRVVGSTFFPWWGPVSENTRSIAPDLFSNHSYLTLRAILALIFLIFLIFYSFRSIKKNSEIRLTSLVIFLMGVFYWTTVGVIFNPEPRYAIFPGFCLIFILFYIQENRQESKIFNFHRKVLIILILLTWVGSWSPSELRVSGPTWATEYRKAQERCLTGIKRVVIPIIPLNADWAVLIDCKKISSPYPGTP